MLKINIKQPGSAEENINSEKIISIQTKERKNYLFFLSFVYD